MFDFFLRSPEIHPQPEQASESESAPGRVPEELPPIQCCLSCHAEPFQITCNGWTPGTIVGTFVLKEMTMSEEENVLCPGSVEPFESRLEPDGPLSAN
jgi:hypothetical protein